MTDVRIHPTAEVDETAHVGEDSVVWHLAQVREDAVVGSGCVLGRGAYVGPGVRIGDCVKVQNHALVYEPAVIGDFCFIGPGAVITNDRFPRSTDPSGLPKSSDDWEAEAARVMNGASIGACAVIVGGVTIGAWAMVGAGAVAVKDVPAHALVVGNPARQLGWVGRSGKRLEKDSGVWVCPETSDRYREDAYGLQLITVEEPPGIPQV